MMVNPAWATVAVKSFSYSILGATFTSGATPKHRASMTLEEEA
jgi:hypothetical protein